MIHGSVFVFKGPGLTTFVVPKQKVKAKVGPGWASVGICMHQIYGELVTETCPDGVKASSPGFPRWYDWNFTCTVLGQLDLLIATLLLLNMGPHTSES